MNHVIKQMSLEHFIYIFIYFVVAILIGFILRKKDKKVVNIIIFVLAIFYTFCEVTKYINRFDGNFKNSLYYPFCALYVPALILTCFKYEHIKKIGLTFLAFGCFFGGAAYIFNPGGGIITNPIFSIQSIYGTTYHFSMFTTAVIILFNKNYYIPKLSDYRYYAFFITIFAVPSLILNKIYGANLLFLDNPIGAPILNDIYLFSKPLYTCFSLLGQGCFFFFMGYYLYQLINLIDKKKKHKIQTKEPVL